MLKPGVSVPTTDPGSVAAIEKLPAQAQGAQAASERAQGDAT